MKKNLVALALGLFAFTFAFETHAQTTDEIIRTLQAQIQALTQQIASLQAQLSATQTQVQSIAIAQNLSFGMTNSAEVANLQRSLKEKGFFSGDVTGNFFTITLDAVKRYQAATGLPTTGYVGPQTRASLGSGTAATPTGTIAPAVVNSPATQTAPAAVPAVSTTQPQTSATTNTNTTNTSNTGTSNTSTSTGSGSTATSSSSTPSSGTTITSWSTMSTMDANGNNRTDTFTWAASGATNATLTFTCSPADSFQITISGTTVNCGGTVKTYTSVTGATTSFSPTNVSVWNATGNFTLTLANGATQTFTENYQQTLDTSGDFNNYYAPVASGEYRTTWNMTSGSCSYYSGFQSGGYPLDITTTPGSSIYSSRSSEFCGSPTGGDPNSFRTISCSTNRGASAPIASVGFAFKCQTATTTAVYPSTAGVLNSLQAALLQLSKLLGQ